MNKNALPPEFNVLVIDSGTGGRLSADYMRRKFYGQSGTSLIRFSAYIDQANAPYGNRELKDIAALTVQNILTAHRMGYDMVMLACFTASTALLLADEETLAPLRALPLGFLMNMVNTSAAALAHICEPACSVAIFGTALTTRTALLGTTLKRLRPDLHVTEVAIPGLAAEIDRNGRDRDISGHIGSAVAEIAKAKTTGGAAPDIVFAACTHYPVVLGFFPYHLLDIEPAQEPKIISHTDLLKAIVVEHLTRYPDLAKGPARLVLPTDYDIDYVTGPPLELRTLYRTGVRNLCIRHISPAPLRPQPDAGIRTAGSGSEAPLSRDWLAAPADQILAGLKDVLRRFRHNTDYQTIDQCLSRLLSTRPPRPAPLAAQEPDATAWDLGRKETLDQHRRAAANPIRTTLSILRTILPMGRRRASL